MSIPFAIQNVLKCIVRLDKEDQISKQHANVVSRPNCFSISVNYCLAILRISFGPRGKFSLRICFWEHSLTKGIDLLDHETT